MIELGDWMRRINVLIEEMTNLLDAAQAKENNGRGVSCVRSIVHYLRAGDFDSAQQVRRLDGDKTSQYPEIERLLLEIFGCRLHGNRTCTVWPCTKE